MHSAKRDFGASDDILNYMTTPIQKPIKFCPLPWVNLSVRNNGDMRICCHANGSQSKGIFRKEDGAAYNASTDNLDEARNSQLAKDIRTTMLQGVDHDACGRCDREDAAGVESRRQYETQIWKDTITAESAADITEEDGTIDTTALPLLYYDLRFGNLCNLKCRMCGPTDSSAWYDDTVALWGKTYFFDTIGKIELVKNKNDRFVTKNDVFGWFDSPSFWEQLDANIPNIKRIHTVGGEPLLITQHYDLLQRCVDSGYSKNILVEYNTNLTNVPTRAWKIWEHFGKIQIGISIDGVGPVNDYIRNPSKFDALVKNIRKLDATDGQFNVWLAYTVQAYNILHLPDFMKWVITEDFARVGKRVTKPIVTTHPLHNPSFLSIKILPPAAKALVRIKNDEFYVWLEDYVATHEIDLELSSAYIEHSQKILEGYYVMMMSEDLSHEIPKFLEYTNKLDAMRGESFAAIFPELNELMVANG